MTNTGGTEVIPFGVDLVIKDELGLMDDVVRDISKLCKPANFPFGKDFVLAPMHMDFSVRKIGQPTDVVEVHVCKNNVIDIFRLVPQVFQSIDCRFVWVKGHYRNNAEKSRHPGRVSVIVETEACVHQNQALVCFHQKTCHARFQFARPASITSEAIQQMNGHINSVDEKVGHA